MLMARTDLMVISGMLWALVMPITLVASSMIAIMEDTGNHTLGGSRCLSRSSLLLKIMMLLLGHILILLTFTNLN